MYGSQKIEHHTRHLGILGADVFQINFISIFFSHGAGRGLVRKNRSKDRTYAQVNISEVTVASVCFHSGI